MSENKDDPIFCPTDLISLNIFLVISGVFTFLFTVGILLYKYLGLNKVKELNFILFLPPESAPGVWYIFGAYLISKSGHCDTVYYDVWATSLAGVILGLPLSIFNFAVAFAVAVK